MLTAVENAINRRLSGDAYRAYGLKDRRFEGESLESLYKIRQKLQAEVALEHGQCFQPAVTPGALPPHGTPLDDFDAMPPPYA
jgi:hypothetical protein